MVRLDPTWQETFDALTCYLPRSQAHPRVIECEGAEHKKCDTLEDACKAMKDSGFEGGDIFVKKSVETKVTSLRKGKYYAVAGGKTTRVFTAWE